MASYRYAKVPAQGERIGYGGGALQVPSNPIIPFIEGDGTGPDIWRASVRVLDAAVERAYAGRRRIHWMKVFAGEESFNSYADWLPQETVGALQEFRVSIKGPLSTPVGGGIRSLNVTLRQVVDLYACIRPVRYFEGVGNPMKHPERLDVVIFRENTEDVYAGIEWKAGSPEARKLREYIRTELGKDVREGSALGIKPMSEFGSKRLVEKAFRYALQRNLPSVTTHGTAPKYANHDKVNQGSVLLSGVMMLEYMGWPEAGQLIVRGLENAIKAKRVTYDLARQMPGATEVSTSAFGDQIIRSMPA